MFEALRISMEEDQRHWHIQWRHAPSGTVTLYGGMHPEHIDHSRPLGQTEGKALRVPVTSGIYFCLELDGSGQLAGPRRMPFRTVPNFRELGGYPVGDGRQLRWGQLYRSGHLADLTDAGDEALLSSLRIGKIIDFRHHSEVKSQPHRLPPSPPQLSSLPITPGSLNGYQRWWDHDGKLELSADEMAQKMCEINRDLAIGQSEHYQRMFELLVMPCQGALLINCTAGKDRTGFGVALVLLALGATREAVMSDYMLSAEFLGTEGNMKRVLRRYGVDDAILLDSWRPVLTVRREYLQHAFDAIDEHYPSTEDYLEQRLGVDHAMRTALRDRFTE